MTLTDAIKKRINNLCQERNITINDLSKLYGIPSSTIQNIFDRPRSIPRISTIERICDELSITVADFFVNDLFRNLDPN